MRFDLYQKVHFTHLAVLVSIYGTASHYAIFVLSLAQSHNTYMERETSHYFKNLAATYLLVVTVFTVVVMS